ncbi:MAG: enoyl-CoA hydratase-related protein [Cyclobacteriaceae bacterium]|nr:enoyl-CoA hydratase-related protein [Cyclobacteriaceae bacterium]
MFEHLNKSVSDTGICTLTLNRPDALNALNRKLLEELKQAFLTIYEDSSIKAVLITGSGEKAFAAGADITELQSLDQTTAQSFSESGQQIFQLIENCPKPVLAAVNGFALGGGCELAMACHLRSATQYAKFGQPEINLGIIPGYGGTQRLTRYLGKAKSLELHLTGDMISAEEALHWGLVNFIAPDKDSLMEKSYQLLDKVAKKAPFATEMIINSINSYYDKSSDGFLKEAENFGKCTTKEDYKEGVSAFLEKRKPTFKGN